MEIESEYAGGIMHAPNVHTCKRVVTASPKYVSVGSFFNVIEIVLLLYMVTIVNLQV